MSLVWYGGTGSQLAVRSTICHQRVSQRNHQSPHAASICCTDRSGRSVFQLLFVTRTKGMSLRCFFVAIHWSSCSFSIFRIRSEELFAIVRCSISAVVGTPRNWATRVSSHRVSLCMSSKRSRRKLSLRSRVETQLATFSPQVPQL